MKIILKKDYELLGDEGQILEVKNGYARNFLIPNGIATIASPANLKSFEEIKKQRAKKVQKLIDEAAKVAANLASNTVTITVKTGEDDKVFGSVTSQMIYDKLMEKGFEDLDKKKIILKEPIRSLGEHEIDVKLHSSVIAKVKVNVVKEAVEETPVSEETTTPDSEEAPAEAEA